MGGTIEFLTAIIVGPLPLLFDESRFHSVKNRRPASGSSLAGRRSQYVPGRRARCLGSLDQSRFTSLLTTPTRRREASRQAQRGQRQRTRLRNRDEADVVNVDQKVLRVSAQ